jgi:hypothetical protein
MKSVTAKSLMFALTIALSATSLFQIGAAQASGSHVEKAAAKNTQVAQQPRYQVKMWFTILNSNDGVGDNTLELYGEARVNGTIIGRIDRNQASAFKREAGQTVEMGTYITTDPNVIVDAWLNDADSGSSDDPVFRMGRNIDPRMNLSSRVGGERRITYRASGGESAMLHIRVDQL